MAQLLSETKSKKKRRATMNKEEAYKIIEQVCVQFHGTLQEHQVIQQALKQLKPEQEKITSKAENNGREQL